MIPSLPIKIIGRSRSVVYKADCWSVLKDLYQAFFVLELKRSEQDSIRETVNSNACADAEAKGQKNCNRKAPRFT